MSACCVLSYCNAHTINQSESEIYNNYFTIKVLYLICSWKLSSSSLSASSRMNILIESVFRCLFSIRFLMRPEKIQYMHKNGQKWKTLCSSREVGLIPYLVTPQQSDSPLMPFYRHPQEAHQ